MIVLLNYLMGHWITSYTLHLSNRRDQSFFFWGGALAILLHPHLFLTIGDLPEIPTWAWGATLWFMPSTSHALLRESVVVPRIVETGDSCLATTARLHAMFYKLNWMIFLLGYIHCISARSGVRVLGMSSTILHPHCLRAKVKKINVLNVWTKQKYELFWSDQNQFFIQIFFTRN